MNAIMSDDRKREIVSELRDVQATFAEAWEQLNALVQELGDRHAEAYLTEQLKTMIFADHGVIRHDLSIEEYAKQIEEALNEDPAPMFDE